MNLPILQLREADRARLEQLLLDFDQNWTEHHLGIIAGQLDAASPEFQAVGLVELVKIDLDYRQRNEPTRLEWYLDRFPELGASQDTLSELLQAEIEVWLVAGEAPSVADLMRRFPSLQDRLATIVEQAEQGKVRSLARCAKREAEAIESDKPSLGSTASIALAAQETLPPTSRKQNTPSEKAYQSLGQFGRYRLLRELGRGAMGTVYLAEDTELRRHVALKRPRIGENEATAMLQRFYREAYAAATLNHPNICPVYDIGEHEGVPYITMAYVEGKTLSRVIRESRALNPRAVALLVRKIAVALAEAHDKGVIHRDLKPGNIMLNHRSEPIVMDFGLARQVEHADDRLSVDGMLIGTPGYMSPEQVDGDLAAVGRASDIYSLGVVLFELLTGRLPFQGSVAAVIGKILRDEAPAPSSLRAGLPHQFDEVGLKMMAKSPGDRYASMTEVAEALGSLSKKLGDEATTAAAPPPVESTTTAQLAAQRQQISQMIQNGQWREASLQLQRMSELQDPVAAAYAQWAREQMTALHLRWEQEQTVATRLLAEAKEDFAQYDYAGATQRLVKIDKQLMTVESQQLLDESLKLAEEVDLLIHLIEQGLNGGKQTGMFRNMQRLLQLQPRNPLVRDLYRKFRWQQRLGWFGATLADVVSLAGGRKRSIHDEPLLRKWLAMAAVVFLISFGLMTWAVMSYLNDDHEIAERSAETAVAVDESLPNPGEAPEPPPSEVDEAPEPEPTDAAPPALADRQEGVGERPPTSDVAPIDAERAAAEWVINNGGAVVVNIRKNLRIDAHADLPADRFHVISVLFTKSTPDAPGMDALANLAQLMTVTLVGAEITDEHLRWLTNAPAFQSLGLADSAVTDSGLEFVSNIEGLKSLVLVRTKVTDAGLMHLRNMKQLTQITLTQTAVTNDGVAELQRALPKCKVVWDGPPEPTGYQRPTLPRISQQPFSIMTHGLPIPPVVKPENSTPARPKAGVFAHIRGPGKMRFPKLDIKTFAAELDIQVNSADHLTGVVIAFGSSTSTGPVYGVRAVGKTPPPNQVVSNLCVISKDRTGYRRPPIESVFGETVKLTLLVGDDRQLLYAEGITAGPSLPLPAYNPEIEIDVAAQNVDLIIHRFLLRALTDEEKSLLFQAEQ